MRKTRTQPRYIEPANVDVGDLIRVEWSAQGIEHTRTARVHRRIDDGELRGFYTAEGTEIMHWVPGNRRNAKVILLEKPEKVDSMVTLIGLDL